MTERKCLPSRRANLIHKLSVGGQRVYLTVGLYDDGTPGEVFVDISRAGSALRALASTAAVFMSIGLQHGVELSTFLEAMRGQSFEPSGAVECSSGGVTEAESILDLVARELEACYLRPAAPLVERVAGRPEGWHGV